MKIKLVSFTNYKLNLDVYDKSDIDFFSYLLLDLIKKKKEHLLLDEIRVLMDIPDKLAYMLENSFYKLLENNLIVSKNEEYLSAYLDDIQITYLGEECFQNKVLYTLISNENKEINISPFKDEIVALSDKDEISESYVVLNKVNSKEKVEQIINDNLKKVFPTYKNVRIVIKNMEVDSYMFEYDYVSNALDEYGLKDNLVFFDCTYRDVKEEGMELSVKSLNIDKIVYDTKGYDFIGVIDGIEYGFYYYVIEEVPYIKRFKIK